MIGIVGKGVNRPDLAILGAGRLERRAMCLGERLEADAAVGHRSAELSNHEFTHRNLSAPIPQPEVARTKAGK